MRFVPRQHAVAALSRSPNVRSHRHRPLRAEGSGREDRHGSPSTGRTSLTRRGSGAGPARLCSILPDGGGPRLQRPSLLRPTATAGRRPFAGFERSKRHARADFCNPCGDL